MITENQEYNNLINKINDIKNDIKELKEKTLNTKLIFGKYKGCALKEVFTNHISYIYWLLKESSLQLDPRIFDLPLPTREKILDILSLKYEEKDNTFIKTKTEHFDGIYDNWNLGHYGCTTPTCIKESHNVITTFTYTYKDLVNKDYDFIYKLNNNYPYIKWTENYLKSLFMN